MTLHVARMLGRVFAFRTMEFPIRFGNHFSAAQIFYIIDGFLRTFDFDAIGSEQCFHFAKLIGFHNLNVFIDDWQAFWFFAFFLLMESMMLAQMQNVRQSYVAQHTFEYFSMEMREYVTFHVFVLLGGVTALWTPEQSFDAAESMVVNELRIFFGFG